MHLKKIVHRDIKPENILIESLEDLQIKLTDFGFATYFSEESKLEEVLGSPLYMPPEIVRQQEYSSKVDIWSAGVVAYVLLAGKPPFYGKTKKEVYDSIKNTRANMSTGDWQGISDEAKHFINLCLVKNPAERKSAQELLEHPWLDNLKLRRLSKDTSQNKQLVHVAQNMEQFSMATSFQKSIISILSGLMVQREELRDLKEAFQIIDFNQDGTLSLYELKDGLRKVSTFELLQCEGEECYNEIMERCDLDGDGKIDFNEFIQAAIDHRALLNKQNIDIIFNLLDLNQDGCISFQELTKTFCPKDQVVEGAPAKCENFVKEIMREVDKDKDNLISPEEFNEALTSLLKSTVST